MRIFALAAPVAIVLAPLCPVDLCIAASAEAVASPTLDGRWEGAIEVPGTKLGVILNFSGDAAGTIGIPVQGLKDVPLDKVSLADGKATFKIKGIGGDPTFSGTLSADGNSLAGNFTQGGGTFPFELKRAQEPKAASADALAGFDEFVDSARKG